MSVHDVSAVDRLNSLRRTKKSGGKSLSVKNEMSLSGVNRSPYHASLPTSPIRDPRSDADTLRRAMARHQASLSRPESPFSSQNDDLPTTPHRYSSNSRLPPMSTPVLDRRTSASPSLGRRDGYRTVSSTGTTSSVRSRDTPGLEDTKTALRNSQLILDDMDLNSSSSQTLPNSNKIRSSLGEGNPENFPELSTNRYPYLSNSTYSLPRNHRLNKSNRQFAVSLRESQETLLSSSQESLGQESRESLLKRYPSSSLQSTPVPSPDRYSKEKPSSRRGSTCSVTNSPHSSRGSSPKHYENLRSETPFKLRTSFSQNSFPSEYYNPKHSLANESDTFQVPTYRNETRSNKATPYDVYVDPLNVGSSSARSSRKNSIVRSKTPSYYSNEPLMYRKSAPVSPAYSLISSRAASPTDSWRSSIKISPTNSVGSGTYYSRRSSRAASPTNSIASGTCNSRRSSRAASPTNSIGSGTFNSRRSSRAASPTDATVSGAYSRRSSKASSPANSTKSEAHSRRTSREASDTFSRRSSPTVSLPHSQETREAFRSTSPCISVTGATPEYPRRPMNICPQRTCVRNSRTTSPASSVRSSRAASPNCSTQSENTRINSELDELVLLAERQANPHAQVIYVRETFQVVPSCPIQNCQNCKSNQSSEHSEHGTQAFETLQPSELPGHRLVKLSSEESHLLIDPSDKDANRTCFYEKNISEAATEGHVTPVEYFKECSDDNTKSAKHECLIKDNFFMLKDDDDTQICDTSVVHDKKADKSVNVNRKLFAELSQDDQEDTRSVGTQESGASSKLDKSVTVDLSRAGISNIEDLLESLSRRVRDVERIDRDFARINDLADNDDSARAESVASIVSSASSRGREKEKERVHNGETHSVIRRQSVIIEGLTLETEELRKKCQVLEDEFVTPVVDDLNHKLEKVEGKLEETETYCYQVVEENVELKSEIETLEGEISEVQDTFREKDAKEFKKVKWELENLAKTCRNLQIKLGKAQAKASRLRQEKEEIEDQQREQTLWKTTAVVAAAALAAYHLLSRYK
eukprot:GFUD01000723.1.p1 GENE.GFUD01000723.1~~GFUD01000723.1.p1  ORF type:complete len:1039 (+),score=197.49 GFUD01000723.1:946-4062(+)